MHRWIVLILAAVWLVVLGVIGTLHSTFWGAAEVAAALDYWNGMQQLGTLPWWTFNYQYGTSLATSISTIGTSAWLLLLSTLVGLPHAGLVGGLACIAIGAFGTSVWAYRLVGNQWIATAAGILFLLLPSLYVHLSEPTHIYALSAFAIVPWILWNLTAIFEQPTRRHGLLLGLLCGLLLIAHAKAAALLLPLSVFYVIGYGIHRKARMAAPFTILCIGLAVATVLGVLPNLPALREMQLAIGSPFIGTLVRHLEQAFGFPVSAMANKAVLAGVEYLSAYGAALGRSEG